ncbi:putative retropepsins like ltr [Operophtera brumata]|uniref:Putative retropepsins like ltr n=1 Tax=Operophtera brumata TaxID=104452 RepID=A0A0L7KF81_OPEBR|nr:putative retropepsins like ltr [Operophtera brumata]
MSVGKIKEFDMSEGNWRAYGDRMEMYFKANAVKEELKLPILIASMGDAAYELLSDLASPKKPSALEYELVMEMMLNHLDPKPSLLAERYRFRQLATRIKRAYQELFFLLVCGYCLIGLEGKCNL